MRNHQGIGPSVRSCLSSVGIIKQGKRSSRKRYTHVAKTRNIPVVTGNGAYSNLFPSRPIHIQLKRWKVGTLSSTRYAVRGRRPDRLGQIPSQMAISRLHVPPVQQRCLRPIQLVHKSTAYSFPRILLCNARSLQNKLDEFELSLHQHKVDIAAVSETWFHPETEVFTDIADYSLLCKSRSDRRGGGVALCYRSDLNVFRVRAIEVPADVEVLWAVLQPRKVPRSVSVIVFCVVYQPPGEQQNDTLCDHISQGVDTARRLHPDAKLVLLGDFNTLDITPILRHTQTKQIVNCATRGSATLDLIMTDLVSQYSDPVSIQPLATSDHNLVLWLPLASTNSYPKHRINVPSRRLPDTKLFRIQSDIESIDWSPLYSMESAECKLSFFNDTVGSIVNNVAPKTTIAIRANDKPWFTAQIRTLMQLRNQSYRRYGKNSVYKKTRNQLQRQIKKAKRKYFQKHLSSLNLSNPRMWHKEIKKAARLRSVPLAISATKSDQEVADDINRFFSGICQSLPALDLSKLPAYLPSEPVPLLSVWNVQRELSRLSTRKSSHPDDIPSPVIRHCAVQLAPALTDIYNTSLTTGHVPSTWRKSVVVPIPKSPTASDVSELRPISLTPVLCKVLESFISRWVVSDISPVIDSRQFGNLRSTSTCHYLLSLLHFLHSTVDKPKSFAELGLIDFSKAFDRVNHAIALNKVISMGVRPSIVPWICSFLSDRQQQVRYHNSLSAQCHITCGLPQGTKLGPIIFTVMIRARQNEYSNIKYFIRIFHPLRHIFE